MKNLEVVQAELKDAKQIASLYIQNFGGIGADRDQEAWKISRIITRGGQTQLLVLKDPERPDEVLGYTSFNPSLDETPPKVEFANIAVPVRYQGLGYGKFLAEQTLVAIRKSISEHGLLKAEVNARILPKREASLHIFELLGFKRIDEGQIFTRSLDALTPPNASHNAQQHMRFT